MRYFSTIVLVSYYQSQVSNSVKGLGEVKVDEKNKWVLGRFEEDQL